MVENIATGELVGLTPAGVFQINMCDLNADHLVHERKQRTEILRQLCRCVPRLTGPNDPRVGLCRLLREELRWMIPVIQASAAATSGSSTPEGPRKR